MKDLVDFLKKEKELKAAVEEIIFNEHPTDGQYIASAISNMRFDDSNGINQDRDIRGKLFLKPVGKERDAQIDILCDSPLIKSIERTMSHDSSDCIYVNLNKAGQEYVDGVCRKVFTDYHNQPQFTHDADEHIFIGKLKTETDMDADAWYGEKFGEIIIRFGDNPENNMAAEVSVAREMRAQHYVEAIKLLDVYLDSKLKSDIKNDESSPQFQHDDPSQLFLGRVKNSQGTNYDAWYGENFDEIVLRFDNKDDAYRAMDVPTIKNLLLNKNNNLMNNERLEYKSAIKLLDESQKKKSSLTTKPQR